MLLFALAKCASPVNSTPLKHGALNSVTDSTETVIIKKKGEGKCNLARFDVNSVVCFIMRKTLHL